MIQIKNRKRGVIRFNAILTLKLPRDEKTLIQESASKLNLSASEFVRTCTKNFIETYQK